MTSSYGYNYVFTRVLPSEYDAAALMKYVQGKGVALMVRSYPSTMTFEVTSYAYNARGQLYVYSPSHYLATMGCLGENPAEATSIEEWRAKYSSKGSWISIDNEFYGRSEYAKDIFQFREIMQKIEGSNTNSIVEVYISKHHGDFQGTLEIELMKYWVDNHQEYICGSLVQKITTPMETLPVKPIRIQCYYKAIKNDDASSRSDYCRR